MEAKKEINALSFKVIKSKDYKGKEAQALASALEKLKSEDPETFEEVSNSKGVKNLLDKGVASLMKTTGSTRMAASNTGGAYKEGGVLQGFVADPKHPDAVRIMNPNAPIFKDAKAKIEKATGAKIDMKNYFMWKGHSEKFIDTGAFGVTGRQYGISKDNDPYTYEKLSGGKYRVISGPMAGAMGKTFTPKKKKKKGSERLAAGKWPDNAISLIKSTKLKAEGVEDQVKAWKNAFIGACYSHVKSNGMSTKRFMNGMKPGTVFATHYEWLGDTMGNSEGKAAAARLIDKVGQMAAETSSEMKGLNNYNGYPNPLKGNKPTPGNA
jgi:hypothetical protein